MSLRELIAGFLNEVKDILKQYLSETEVAIKKRLQRILVISVMGMILLAIVIALAGAAVLFLLVGSLRYLEMSMPPWEAWDIMGLVAAVFAVALGTLLFLMIRKQLSTKQQN